jgi:PmbA protein
MIKKVKKGIIVGRFSGGSPGANGEFSGVAKNGFMIEDGKITSALSETMISGNLADMLNNLVDISKETLEDGNMVVPYMAFDGITVSGK